MNRSLRRRKHESTPPKPRLLFVGEGPHDVGRDDDPGGALAGFLSAALLGSGEVRDATDLPFVIADVKRWIRDAPLLAKAGKRMSFDTLMGSFEPDTRRAHAFLLMAQQRGLDGVVIMRDCERHANMKLGETLRHARDLYAEQDQAGNTRPACVIAAPSRSHETWLLVDREAVGAIFGSDSAFHFSGDPEERPNSEKMKAYLQAQCEKLHKDEPVIRRRLAFRARPAELGRRCPRCYPAFQEDAEQELLPLFSTREQ